LETEHDVVCIFDVAHACLHLAIVVAGLTLKVARLRIVVDAVDLFGRVALGKSVHHDTSRTSVPVLAFSVYVVYRSSSPRMGIIILNLAPTAIVEQVVDIVLVVAV
jgi:hypothetical protein